MVCEHCRIGRITLSKAPYIGSFRGLPCVVPDVPALVCDACGSMEYDPEILFQFERLLDENLSSPQSGSLAARMAFLENSPVWQRYRRSI